MNRSLQLLGSIGLVIGSIATATPSASAVQVDQLVTFSGVLRDSTGQPVDGYIGIGDAFDDGNSVGVQTGTDGAFSLQALPSVYTLSTWSDSLAAGHEPKDGVIDLTVGDVQQDIWLPTGVDITLRVLRADGTPVEGVYLASEDYGELLPAWPGGALVLGGVWKECTTDAAGACTARTLVTSRSTDWRAQIPNGDSDHRWMLPPVDGTGPVEFTLRLPETHSFSGNVLDSTAGNLTRANVVWLTNTETGALSGDLDIGGDGAFRVDVVPGRYDVKVRAEVGCPTRCAPLILSSSIEVGASDVRRDFLVPAREPVAVTMTDVDGSQVNDFHISGSTAVVSAGDRYELGTDCRALAGECSVQALVGATESDFRAGETYGPKMRTALDPTTPGTLAVELIRFHAYTATARFTDGSIARAMFENSVSDDNANYPLSVPWSMAIQTPPNDNPRQVSSNLSGVVATELIPGKYRLNFTGAWMGVWAGFSVLADLSSGDLTHDFTLPPRVAVDVRVVDRDGNPTSDVVVMPAVQSMPWSFGDGGPVGLIEAQSYGCYTWDSSGCRVSTIAGLPASTWALRLMPSGITWRVPVPEITEDTTELTLQLGGLASVPSQGTVSGDVVIASSEGTEVFDVVNEPVPASMLDPNEDAVTGELSYKVDVAQPGDSAEVTLTLPPGSTPTTLYKTVNGQLVDFTDFATIDGNIVTLQLVDGGNGDADGVANGVIVDPIVPVRGTNTLTVAKAGTGVGSVTSNRGGITCGTDCTQDFRSDATVTLTPTPAAGYAFTGWSGACTGLGTCTVTMDQARSVTASFGSGIALSVTRNGPGTVTSDPIGIRCGAECTRLFPSGATVRLTATPAAGYAFAGWSGACTGTGACTVSMKRARSVGATFVVGIPLTVTTTGSGSVVSSPAGINCGSTCTASFVSGATVTLSPVAAAGYAFAGWSGACTGTGACTVSMTTARSVSATFVPAPTLTVTRAGSGTGTVTSNPAGINCGTTCSAAFAGGANVTLTATAASGSVFTGWSGACSGTGTCTVSMTESRAVTATFAASYTLTVAKRGRGTVVSSPAGISCGSICSYLFAANTVVVLTATPAAGYRFTGWSGACSGTGTCTVTMSRAQSVTAVFAK